MIDWERVCALRDEVGAEDFDEVVVLFLEEVDDEIADLVETRPGNGLEAKLHFLKGSALNLGFDHFSTLCQSGETKMSKEPGKAIDLSEILNSYQTSRAAFLSELPARLKA